MPCSSMLVTHSMCGNCLLLDGAQGGLHRRFVLGPLDVTLAHVAQGADVRKPPVPQAGSKRISPGLGSMRSAMKAVTARGV